MGETDPDMEEAVRRSRESSDLEEAIRRSLGTASGDATVAENASSSSNERVPMPETVVAHSAVEGDARKPTLDGSTTEPILAAPSECINAAHYAPDLLTDAASVERDVTKSAVQESEAEHVTTTSADPSNTLPPDATPDMLMQSVYRQLDPQADTPTAKDDIGTLAAQNPSVASHSLLSHTADGPPEPVVEAPLTDNDATINEAPGDHLVHAIETPVVEEVKPM